MVPPVAYGVDRETGRIDMDQVRELAKREQPKLIFCGGTAIPRTIDFAAFAEIAREVGAVLAADVAHIAGLIAGGAHPSPVGHADIVSTTTHKTLRGPRGAMLMTTEEYAAPINKAIFPGLQGGPHENTIAAIAVALHEALDPAFRDYAHAIVENSRALAAALDERGFDLVSGGSDNHLILIDLTAREITGGPAAEALDRAGISCQPQRGPVRSAQAARPERAADRHPGDHDARLRAGGHGVGRPLDRRGHRGREARRRGRDRVDPGRGARAGLAQARPRHPGLGAGMSPKDEKEQKPAADAETPSPAEEKAPPVRRPSQTQERQEKERASKLEEFQRQVDDGSLVTRRMTPEEREKMPPRPRPQKPSRKR